MLPVSISSAGRVASVRNVLTAIKCLPKIIPGGWPNIRGLYLKTKNSLGIPIYISPGDNYSLSMVLKFSDSAANVR